MALLKRGRMKRLVLDIGTSAIRLCELSPTKAGYQLTKYFQRELHIDPAMDDDEKKTRRKEVLDALLKEVKIRAKKTILAVPGQSVFTRNRPLPPVPEYKVTQIVKYEIQQQIPFSLDQIALDYQVLDRTEAGGYDVMMAAIKVDVVEKALEILEKTKRSIDVVDVAPLAAYNWLKHTGEFGEEGECVALIDLGASTTDIVIQKDNHFRFTRSLNTGGNDITAAVATAFNISFEEAEKVKRERGFAPTGNPQRDGKGGEVIGNVLNGLVSQINRSFAYFRSQPGGGPTQRVIVTGGGACLRNIIPFLQRQLGIEVRIAQPLAGLAVSPAAAEASEHPEQACVVLGLALRCCTNVPIQINLIPPRVLESTRRKEQALYWVLSFATLLLIMASIIPVTAAKNEMVVQRIDLLESVLASYDPAIVHDPLQPSDFEEKFTFLRNDVQAFQDQVHALDAARNSRHFWLDELVELNSIRKLVGGITISSIESAVIGGDQNTGDAVRAQASPPPADGAATPAAAGPSPFGGGPFGGGGGGPAFPQGPAARQAPVPAGYYARGFPGIYPSISGGGAGSAFSTGRERNTGGAAQGPTIVEPNGLILYGYATDTDTLRKFVAALEEQAKRNDSRFIENGVYFHVRSADELADSALDDAQIGGRDVNSARGSAAASGGGEESGGGEGLGSLSSIGSISSGAPSGASFSASPWATRVTAFRIDLQFLGNPIQGPNQELAVGTVPAGNRSAVVGAFN